MITETDAIRTIGQLLLHRPTSHREARNLRGAPVECTAPDAATFCFLGAVGVVQRRLYGVEFHKLLDLCKSICAMEDRAASCQWDYASDSQRRIWAQKLAEYRS